MVGWAWRRGTRRVNVTTALLVGYWGACLQLGDAADPYSLAGWFGTAFDRALLGASHLYRGEGVPFDPEGLASTAPAIAQVLIGWWVANGCARAGQRDHRGPAVRGGLGWPWPPVAAGHAGEQEDLDLELRAPLTSALATALLAALVHRLDLDPRRDRPVAAWVRFGQVFGMNALARVRAQRPGATAAGAGALGRWRGCAGLPFTCRRCRGCIAPCLPPPRSIRAGVAGLRWHTWRCTGPWPHGWRTGVSSSACCPWAGLRPARLPKRVKTPAAGLILRKEQDPAGLAGAMDRRIPPARAHQAGRFERCTGAADRDPSPPEPAFAMTGVP